MSKKKKRLLNLSARQLEVFKQVLGGLTQREVSINLGVHTGTIAVHMHRVYRKLGVNDLHCAKHKYDKALAKWKP